MLQLLRAWAVLVCSRDGLLAVRAEVAIGSRVRLVDASGFKVDAEEHAGDWYVTWLWEIDGQETASLARRPEGLSTATALVPLEAVEVVLMTASCSLPKCPDRAPTGRLFCDAHWRRLGLVLQGAIVGARVEFDRLLETKLVAEACAALRKPRPAA